MIESVNPKRLTSPPSLSERQAGNCPDFSLLLTAMLRYKGIPARACCGFWAYCLSELYEDPWVYEYWNKAEKRWILVDAQLDRFQCEELEISFEPTDEPRDLFIVAGEAWQIARIGLVDPQKFGIFEWRGFGLSGGTSCVNCLPTIRLKSCPGTSSQAG